MSLNVSTLLGHYLGGIYKHVMRHSLVYLMGFTFFLCSINETISEIVTLTLFVENVGVEHLATAYTSTGFLLGIMAFALTYALAHFSSVKVTIFFFGIFTVVTGLSTLGAYLIINGWADPFYLGGPIYAVNHAILELSDIVIWLVPTTFISTQKSKRIFVHFSNAGNLGALAGSGILAFGVKLLNSADFLAASTLITLSVTAIVAYFYQRHWHVLFEEEEDDDEVFLSSFMGFLGKTRYWIPIILIAILLAALGTALNHFFTISADANFKTEANLINYFSFYEILSIAASIIAVTFIFEKVIKALGVWEFLSFSAFLFVVSLSLYVFFKDNIYSSTIAGLIGEVGYEFQCILFAVVYKACVKKYRTTMLSFSDNVTVVVGLITGGLFGLVYQLHWLSFRQYALLATLCGLGILIFTHMSKKNYAKALSQNFNLEEEGFAEAYNVTELISSHKDLDSALEQWEEKSSSLKLLSLQVPFDLKDASVLKYFFRTLNAIEDDNPEVRAEGVLALLRYKDLKNFLVPFLEKRLDDPDELVRIHTLYCLSKINPEKALEYQNLLFAFNDSVNIKTQIKLLSIIKNLKLESFWEFVETCTHSQSPQIRRQAIATLTQMDSVDRTLITRCLMRLFSDKNDKVALDAVQAATTLDVIRYADIKKQILTKNIDLWSSISRYAIFSENIELINALLEKSIKPNLWRYYKNALVLEKLSKEKKSDTAQIVAEYLRSENRSILINFIRLICFEAEDTECIVNSIHNGLISRNQSTREQAIELIEAHYYNNETLELFEPVFRKDPQKQLQAIYALLQKHNESIDYNDIIIEVVSHAEDFVKICLMGVITSNPKLSSGKKTSLVKCLKELEHKHESQLVRDNAHYTLLVLTGAIKKMNKKQKEALQHQSSLISNIIFLKQTELFKRLSISDLSQLSSSIESVSFSKGERIISPQKPAKGIYIIEEGKAGLYRKEGSNLIDIKTYEEKEMFGVEYLYGKEKMATLFVAKTPLSAYFIKRQEFFNIMHSHTDFCEGVIVELCKLLSCYEKIREDSFFVK